MSTEPYVFTVENIRFVGNKPANGRAFLWRAAPDGIAFAILRRERRDGEPLYQVDGASYRSLESAGRAAIRRKRQAIDYARSLVEAYDKAIATIQIERV